MGKKKTKKKRKKAKRNSFNTPLDGHKQKGKKLLPPFLNIPKAISFSSWRDERLPEMVWAALLFEHLEEKDAFNTVRRASIAVRELYMKDGGEGKAPPDMTFSYFATLDDEAFATILDQILITSGTRDVLLPVCIFDDLPGVERWRNKLWFTGEVEDWEYLLGQAVLSCLDHQSEKSTHCRWLRLITTIICGKMLFPQDATEDLEGIRLYPEYGDLKKIRPFIRSSEISLSMPEGTYMSSEWAERFWEVCYEKSGCLMRELEFPKRYRINEKSIKNTFFSLLDHWRATHSNTSINPKHDTLFGLTFYGLSLLADMAIISISVTTLGRAALRTLTELYITHQYLTQKDDESLFKSYRSYGCGQAKLLLLKLRDGLEQPNFIPKETLEMLCNEDYWEEFQEINVGNWATTNLRKMAEESGNKDIYDQYYNMTSAYVHGHWCAVRDSNYTICVNPLHRFHRIPKPHLNIDSDVIPDAVKLMNMLIDSLEEVYPNFEPRLLVDEPDIAKEGGQKEDL